MSFFARGCGKLNRLKIAGNDVITRVFLILRDTSVRDFAHTLL